MDPGPRPLVRGGDPSPRSPTTCPGCGRHAVLSNTFRHPVLVAKAATVIDHVTGGKFVLGLGAGWFEDEHGPFGLALPPIGERYRPLESAVGTTGAVRRRRGRAPGVTRDDPFYPLHGATNLPVPRRRAARRCTSAGRSRGIRLAARCAQGWLLPGTEAGDDDYFRASATSSSARSRTRAGIPRTSPRRPAGAV